MKQEELFEVYEMHNGKPVKVGLAARSLCHKTGLLHRSVHILLFNKSGELYCQKRSMGKDLYPGRYTSSCSGHVDPGETPLAAAYRELAEELGIKKKLELKKLGEFISHGATECELSTLYFGKYDGEIKLCTEEADANGSEFFSRGELESIKERMSPGFKKALEMLPKKLWQKAKARGIKKK